MSSVDSGESFKLGTTEVIYTDPSSKRVYIIRHIPDETCCESPWGDVPEWPVAFVSPFTSSDNEKRVEDEEVTEEKEEEEEEEKEGHSIIGAVWTRDDQHQLVAVWACDPGDGHIEFYGLKSYPHLSDFENLTEHLCSELTKNFPDIFDDGSGITRECLPKKSLNCAALDLLYVGNNQTETQTTKTLPQQSPEDEEKEHKSKKQRNE